jgi:N-acetylglutamate synthase-like GNAT family acetyltransferase
MTACIRPATKRDQDEIVRLVRSERLNPHGLHWPNFIVAEREGRIVGAVQLRPHCDGSHELGSLVVEVTSRGRDISSRLIEQRLAGRTGRILLITNRKFADRYRRWGFGHIEPAAAPFGVWKNYWLGSLVGTVVSFFRRREFKGMAVLERM